MLLLPPLATICPLWIAHPKRYAHPSSHVLHFPKTNCDDALGPSQSGPDRKTNWLKCPRSDLSTRPRDGPHNVNSCGSSDLIGAWPESHRSFVRSPSLRTIVEEVSMIGVVSHGVSSGVQVVIGVDTHQDEHVAVAIDQQGIRLGERRLPATTRGYGDLEQ